MWDNESIGEYIIDNNERLERLRKRFEAEEKKESEDEENERITNIN